jgi:L-threonylcarbamoyladenylate synthase
VTLLLPISEPALANAAELIAAGEIVAVPTETVYGLAADATNKQAVARIYAAKGRPSHNPLIVHVADMEQAERFGARPSEPARQLARLYWPGPLTIVVPVHVHHGFAPAVTAGLRTVALRSPRHDAMQDLIRRTGRPLAAPSANASGSISPTRAAHVMSSLGGSIPLVLDGGPTTLGIESTIVKVEGNLMTTLRVGPIDAAEAAVLAKMKHSLSSTDRIEAPGQLRSHYAPSKPLRLNATRAESGEWLIGFGAIEGDDNLSPSGNLDEAAARLFAALHRADTEAPPRIAVAAIPETGTGVAINDRLRRAAAPRP